MHVRKFSNILPGIFLKLYYPIFCEFYCEKKASKDSKANYLVPKDLQNTLLQFHSNTFIFLFHFAQFQRR